MKTVKLTGSIAALFLSSVAVRADVEISAKATSNMDCESGVCTAIAQKAVLNVTDLANMLASGDVAVKTGSVAKDIDIDQPLTWSSTSRLTLDAQASVTVKKQLTVAGQGALTVVTNDTGQPRSKTGEFIIVPEHGSVQFWDLSSSLVIDGNAYTLGGDIKTLASDIAANPSGFYALAKPYDASVDGTYASSPIPTEFSGTFDGLGNTISNMHIDFSAASHGVIVGLFSQIDNSGFVRQLALKAAGLQGTSGIGLYGAIGVLVGVNEGTVNRVTVKGELQLPGGAEAQPGGLVGENDGMLSYSSADVSVKARSESTNVGALAGANFGSIVSSYSKGSVSGGHSIASVNLGGLVGRNGGSLKNTYALASVHQPKNCCKSIGGLVGINDSTSNISASYAAGTMKIDTGQQGSIGGVIGVDNSSGSIVDTYWDLNRGIGDQSQGAGNIANDPGISGLTEEQLKAQLPNGFDPKAWAQEAGRNRGFPYLRGLSP